MLLRPNRVYLVFVTVLMILVLAVPNGMDAKSLPVLGTMRTVLKGTQIEEFPVEIHGTFGQEDLILIKISDELVLRCGGIAEGMSGSPVYLDGELIGALSYALGDRWNQYALVTPIGSMQEILRLLPPTLSMEPDQQPRPAMSPILTYGYTPRALQVLQDRFPLRNLGAFSQAPQAEPCPPDEIEPGSAIAVQLVYGDVAALAVGTLTWCDGEHFLAFGHPLYHAGDVVLNLSRAFVVETVDAYPLPFKLAYPTQNIGTVLQDRNAGIAGTIGVLPSYTQVCLDIMDISTGSREQSTFYVMQDESLISYLLGSSALSLVDLALDRVGSGTAMVSFSIESADLSQPLCRDNLHYGSDIGASVLGELLEAVSMLVDNQFRAIKLDRIAVDIVVWDAQETVAVTEASVEKSSYSPGDEVAAEIMARPYRQQAQKHEVILEVPADWPVGHSTLLVESGGSMYYYMAYLDPIEEADSYDAARVEAIEEISPDVDSLDLLIGKFTDRLRNNQIQVTLMNLENEKTVRHTIDLPYVATGSAFCELEFGPKEDALSNEEELLQTGPEGEEIAWP